MNMDEKKAFRKAMLLRRDAIPYENRIEADKGRNELIRNWETYKNAEWLLFYVSYRSEADTLQLLKEALKAGRNVAVPKVLGTDMVFYRITDFSQLIEGYKGILEPDGAQAEVLVDCDGVVTYADGRTLQNGEKREAFTKDAILFVPGCAFDERGGRMGYGGGFYDRFMEKYPEVMRVAFAYEEQLVEEVPREAHDKAVDVIVTEARIVQVPKSE